MPLKVSRTAGGSACEAQNVGLTRAQSNQEGVYMTVKISVLPVHPEKVSNDEGKELKPPADHILVCFLPFPSSAAMTNNFFSLKHTFFPQI